MNKEEFEDYQKLSGEITEKLDNTSTYENWLIIQEYVDKLQQENKQLKDKLNFDLEWAFKYEELQKRIDKTIENLQIGIDTYNNGGSRTSLFECISDSIDILEGNDD